MQFRAISCNMTCFSCINATQYRSPRNIGPIKPPTLLSHLQNMNVTIFFWLLILTHVVWADSRSLARSETPAGDDDPLTGSHAPRRRLLDMQMCCLKGLECCDGEFLRHSHHPHHPHHPHSHAPIGGDQGVCCQTLGYTHSYECCPSFYFALDCCREGHTHSPHRHSPHTHSPHTR